MLVRTWNLFHGKPSPPGRRAFLLQMIELVTRDRPDVVCVQELPVWALPHLEGWSRMHASGAVARRPLLPVGARAVTALHHGLLRSAVTGEADAILTREPALGSRARGSGRGVTFDEARAQFPVLDRYSYLNAGSIGPLPKAAVEAVRARLERDLAEGRSGKAYIEWILEQRERARGDLAAVLGASPERVALTDSTTRGCQIVSASRLGCSAVCVEI